MESCGDSVEIRPYKDSDETDVVGLWRRVFPNAPSWNVPEDDIRRKRAIQGDLFFVAVRDERVVGTAMAGYDGHRGWVYYVAVDPRCRRLGVGKALMAAVEGAVLQLGCPKLNLQVRASNHEAVAFYKSLRYETEERISMGKRLGDVDSKL